MKVLKTELIATLVVLASSFLFQVSSAQENSQTRFDKPLLTFDLTVHNPGHTTKHLVKVGVHSTASGRFECMSGSGAIMPIADYQISFHVADAETVIPADPILKLLPNDSVRFTISLIPEATGACGFWSAMVSAFAIFDDGTRLETSPELITERDVEEYEKKYSDWTPSDEEIFVLLRHRGPAVRIKAIMQLPNSKIDAISRKRILEAKLQDQNQAVRYVAGKIAVDLGINSLTPVIVENLSELVQKVGNPEDKANQSGDHHLIDYYFEVLEKSKDPKAIEVILAAFTDSNYYSRQDGHRGSKVRWSLWPPTRTLVNLKQPEVPEKVHKIILQHSEWLTGEITDEQARCYSELCIILIEYRYMDAIPVLSSAILQSHHDLIYERLVWYLLGSTNREALVLDPFLLAMTPTLQKALQHSNSSIRLDAIELLLRMQTSISERDEVEMALKILLEDQGNLDPYSYRDVKLRATLIAGSWGFKSLVPIILRNLSERMKEIDNREKRQADWREKRVIEDYCYVLEKLDNQVSITWIEEQERWRMVHEYELPLKIKPSQ